MSFSNFTWAFQNGIPLFNGTTAAFGTNCCCPLPDGYLPIADCSDPYIPGTADFCTDPNVIFYATAAYSGKAYAQILGGGFRVCRYVIPTSTGTTCPSPDWAFGSFVDVGSYDPVYESCAACECDCSNGSSPNSLTITFTGITTSTCSEQGAQSRQFQFLEGSGYNFSTEIFPSTATIRPLFQCWYEGTVSVRVRQTLHTGSTDCSGPASETNDYRVGVEALWTGTGYQVIMSGTAAGGTTPAVYTESFFSNVVARGTNDCSATGTVASVILSATAGGIGRPAFGGVASVVPNF